jgi:hypothetical protein
MKLRLYGGILSAAAALIFWAGPSSGVVHMYLEDFTTTQYKDALNTTLWWDTVTGELKLRPFVLTLAGTYDTPDQADGIFVSGNHAYVADGASGLLVIDISNPAAPTLSGSYDTPGNAAGVFVAGDHAFVADGLFGLQVLDVSNPAFPAFSGAYNTPGSAQGVFVAGDHAYVADDLSGLQVINIRIPATPTLAGTHNTPGQALGVYVSGDHAYVADGASGLRVVDISNPATPTLAGTYDTPGQARGVFVAGDHAFVADDLSGLQVIDISDPTTPALSGTYNTPGWAFGVHVSGDRAFVADEDSGLQVIDISDPTAPTLSLTFDTAGFARGVWVSGDHAFVADHLSGLQVIDVGDPTTPALSGTYDTPGDARGIFVAGDHAFVGDNLAGFHVVDISDPTTPVLSGTYDTPGDTRGVFVSGNHAYVADEASGLQVIDISDPDTPTLAGTYDTPGNARGVHVSGDHAFVADDVQGLQVIDISEPATPTLAGTYDTGGNALEVYVSGDHAFVADYLNGLVIIDVSDPTTPTLAGTYNTTGAARDVYVSGDHAFVADWSSGLLVIDVSDPTTPTLAGTYNTTGLARGVWVSGDYAYVADDMYGLKVIDISNPTAPALFGAYDTPGTAWSVSVSGELAYLVDGASGLHVIQVFQSEVDEDNNVGQSLAVDASNDTIFAARLTTTQNDSIAWEVSADGGAGWQGIEADGVWNQLSAPGTDLVWRSTHYWAAPGVNPGATQLEIDWLGAAPSISMIADVPGDQGGWVRVSLTRSGRDHSDQTALPISNYGIWRRLDDSASPTALSSMSHSSFVASTAGGSEIPNGIPVVWFQGRAFVRSITDLAPDAFPPGTWEWVATIPAVQQEAYIASVPTLADSTGSGSNQMVLVTTAHTTTPSIWYASEPDSGYSVDNLAPAAPESFSGEYLAGTTMLHWMPCTETDFTEYRLHRGKVANFVPDPGNLVVAQNDTGYVDVIGEPYFYKLSAIDVHGNESSFAFLQPDGTVGIEPVSGVPARFALYPCTPNPMRNHSVIHFDLPVRASVRLSIYDTQGRLVRRAFNERELSAGRHEWPWDGRNDAGVQVSTGMYFISLETPLASQTRKAVVLE